MSEAIELKSSDPARADKLYKMSQDEFNHFSNWHNFAIADKTDAEQSNREAAEALLAVMKEMWGAQHKEAIESAANYKRLVDLYREL